MFIRTDIQNLGAAPSTFPSAAFIIVSNPQLVIFWFIKSLKYFFCITSLATNIYVSAYVVFSGLFFRKQWIFLSIDGTSNEIKYKSVCGECYLKLKKKYK